MRALLFDLSLTDVTHLTKRNSLLSWLITIFLLKGRVAQATDALQPWRLILQPYEEDDEVFSSALPL